MGSTRSGYEALLMDNKGPELAKVLRTKETSNPMRRFATAVSSGKDYDEMFGESVLIIPTILKQKYKTFLTSAISQVKEEIEHDMTPSPPSSQDLNATVSEDPSGGRRRRTRKNKKSRRKTRKHRR